jgi:acyl-CoA reductase-like NAD-dependent aldehyde dehydrogenase
VVDFIQHSPEDAVICFEAMISHKAVRKCNFTGSTAVGRHVAQLAAFYLKSVTMELGVKNFSIMLEDADLENAANQVLSGAHLTYVDQHLEPETDSDNLEQQSGQICMSTDIVFVARSVEQQFRKLLRQKLLNEAQQVTNLINPKSKSRIDALVENAKAGGATMKTVETTSHASPIILEGITSTMDSWSQESLGPLLELRIFDDEKEAVSLAKRISIWSFGCHLQPQSHACLKTR